MSLVLSPGAIQHKVHKRKQVNKKDNNTIKLSACTIIYDIADCHLNWSPGEVKRGWATDLVLSVPQTTYVITALDFSIHVRTSPTPFTTNMYK